MNIKIHPSLKGKIVEIFSESTRILLDYGTTLEENEVLLVADLKKLHEFENIDGIFLSHHNTDHATTLPALIEGVPIYSSHLTAQVALAAEAHKSKKPFNVEGYYKNKKTITVGDIKVTPLSVGDESQNAYALLIENRNKCVLFAGDYKANSQVSFEKMVSLLPVKVDVLLCFEDMITDYDINVVTERDVEEQIFKIIDAAQGPVFVLQAPTDFERIKTVYYASQRAKRVYLEDLYMAQIANATDKLIPNPANWQGVKAYLTTGYKDEHFRYQTFKAQPRFDKSDIAKENFVMSMRISMKKYLKMLDQLRNLKDGVIINALPDDQLKASKEFLSFAQTKGLTVEYVRTSGHAGAKALKHLIEYTNPKKIVPLNQKNLYWLRRECPEFKILDETDIYC